MNPIVSQSIIVALQLVLKGIEGFIANGEIDTIISWLSGLLPTIYSEIADAVPIVQQILTNLKGSGKLTSDQEAVVDQMNSEADAYYAGSASGVAP